MGNQRSTLLHMSAGASENTQTFEKFTELPDAMGAQIFSALPLEKKAALAQTSMR